MGLPKAKKKLNCINVISWGRHKCLTKRHDVHKVWSKTGVFFGKTQRQNMIGTKAAFGRIDHANVPWQ